MRSLFLKQNLKASTFISMIPLAIFDIVILASDG